MTYNKRRARMAELLSREDRAALLEHMRLWMAAGYSGSPQNRKLHGPITRAFIPITT